MVCLNEEIIDKTLLIQFKESSCKKIDCSLNWKLNQKKLVEKGDQCLVSCNNSQLYKYEYNGKCYEQCDNGTMTLNGIQYCKCKSEKCLFCPTVSFLNRDLCIKCSKDYYPMENDPSNIGDYINCYKDLDGYYLDKNDLLYKKCFYRCETCEVNGNEKFNNCKSCNKRYSFPIHFNNYYNCYDKPYYNDSNGKTYELINNENTSYRMISTSSDSQIMYECSLDDDLNDNCNFLNDLNNSDISNIIEDNINLIYSSNKGKSQVIQGEDNVIYQITSSANELKLLEGEFENNQDISIIDLGQCENKLKEYYGLNESDSLIYLKQENKSAKSTEKNFQYEVFEPYNFTKLNLSICEGDTINLYIKIDLSEETKEIYESMKSMGYNMFNIKDPFYHDICIPYTYKNNIDILLSDRIDYIYNNKDSQCQSNCQFSSYLKNSLYINCTCAAIDDIKDNIKHFNGKKLYESFYDVLKYSNFHVLKCYKLVFVKNVIIKNLGSIIILIVVLLYLFCLIFFIIKGILPLINKIKFIKEKSNEKFERNNELSIHKIQKDNKENNPSQIINNNNEKILMNPNKKKIRLSIDNSDTKNNLNNKKFETRKKKVKSKTAKLSKVNNLLIKNFSSSQDVITNSKKNQNIIIVDSFINKDDKKIENLDPYELNDLEYDEAITKDKRSFYQTYWDTLCREHKIIFTFLICNDYNILYIKFARFIFLFLTDMAMNVFFFSDESMHKVFLNYGKFDFIQQIPQIIYTTIVSQIMEIFLCYLSLTDKYIYQIKNSEQNLEEKDITKILRCIQYKLIIFFIITFILSGFYWYLVAAFCAVYENTQIIFLKDCLSSFILGLLYPFFIYLFPSALRIISIKYSKHELKCIYKLSDIIPFF